MEKEAKLKAKEEAKAVRREKPTNAEWPSWSRVAEDMEEEEGQIISQPSQKDPLAEEFEKLKYEFTNLDRNDKNLTKIQIRNNTRLVLLHSEEQKSKLQFLALYEYIRMKIQIF